MSIPELSGKVQTVLGPIDPHSLGITIMHEHLLIDLRAYFEEPPEASERAWIDAPITMDRLGGLGRRWYFNLATLRLLDTDVAVDEVCMYRYAGGNSLVDATSIGIARDPLALARISRATGLNIVMGGGYYVRRSHPPDMDDRSEDSIAEEIVRDIAVGVGETGVRTGIIGELGNDSPLNENEKKVLRASARAQTDTGAPITIHPGLDEHSPHEILDVLVKAGADPHRVVMGHLGQTIKDRGALKSLAESGCFLEYDQIGSFEDTSVGDVGYQDFVISDVQEIGFLEFLVAEGHLDQILISHDVCFGTHHVRNGGKGFGHILENIVPRMRRRGFTQDQIDAILVENPRRALTFQ